jgi:hypothetical protein
MVTGAVVYYNEDRYSGGGGVNVDGLGAHFRKAYSRVGIELRLVDMDTSEVCWSTMVESWVSATEVGMDMFRFVTAWGEDYLVSAEAGVAQYLPTDFALQICMASAVVDMIRENEAIFIAKEGVQEEPEDAEPVTKREKKPEKQEGERPGPYRQEAGAKGKEAQASEGPERPQEKQSAQQAPPQREEDKPGWVKPPGAVKGW